MSSLPEIELAIARLPRADFFQLVENLRKQYWDEWDRQIEEDSAAGRLDFLLKELDEDIAKGRTRPADELCDDSQVPKRIRRPSSAHSKAGDKGLPALEAKSKSPIPPLQKSGQGLERKD